MSGADPKRVIPIFFPLSASSVLISGRTYSEKIILLPELPMIFKSAPGSSAMAAALQGADLKIIGNCGNKMIFSVYVKPEIKTVEALKGKKIGLTDRKS